MHSVVWGVSTWSEKASDARSMAGYSGTSTADEAEADAVEGTTGLVFLVEVVIVPLPPPLPPPAVVVVLVVASDDVPGWGWTGGGTGGAPVEERAAPTRAATMGK